MQCTCRRLRHGEPRHGRSEREVLDVLSGIVLLDLEHVRLALKALRDQPRLEVLLHASGEQICGAFDCLVPLAGALRGQCVDVSENSKIL